MKKIVTSIFMIFILTAALSVFAKDYDAKADSDLKKHVEENLVKIVELAKTSIYVGLDANEMTVFKCSAMYSMESGMPVGTCIISGEMSYWTVSVLDIENYPIYKVMEISREL